MGCLKPYFLFKDTLSYSCKTVHFKEAVKAIELYIIETRVSIIIKLKFNQKLNLYLNV